MAEQLRTDRTRTSRDARSIVLDWQRGDALLQDKVLHPDTIREAMARLAQTGGALAYTPEFQARISTVLEQRFNSDIGNDVFVAPNYAPYEDPELAAFYGIKTLGDGNMQTRKETFQEQKERLITETVREVEVELPGMAQMMERYRREGWARHGVADEAPFIHSDPDVTLFRNEMGGWATVDIPISTSDKSNVIDMFEGEPEFVFPRVHPAWETDAADGYYDSLS